MKDIQLHIAALNASITSDKNFVVVLQENNGTKRLSMIIGLPEAQLIAVALEQLKPPRPLTHDLLLDTINRLNARLKHVKLTAITEGVYFSVIVLKDKDENLIEIDSRASDAVALATRQKCPILISEELLNEFAINIPAESKVYNDKRLQLEQYSIEELYKVLASLLEKEDYESAGIVRDIISEREQS
jgi:bifunctional DNase/RNase